MVGPFSYLKALKHDSCVTDVRVGAGPGRVRVSGVEICLEPLHHLKCMQIAVKLLLCKGHFSKVGFLNSYLSATLLVSDLIYTTNAHTRSVNNGTNKLF